MARFVGSLREFVGFGFCCLVRRLGLLVRGFAARFVGSSTGFVVFVFSVLFSRLGLLFLCCCGFFLEGGLSWIFFSEGEAEEKEIEVCWVSFVEIKCLILEFHSEF